MYQFSMRPVTLQSVWMMTRARRPTSRKRDGTGTLVRSVAADRSVALFDVLKVRSLVET